jgi:hypothetical protein
MARFRELRRSSEKKRLLDSLKSSFGGIFTAASEISSQGLK